MSWVGLVPAIALTACILFAPGASVAALLGIRGFGILGAAAPISVSIVACAAVLAPMIGLGWGPLPVVAVWLGMLLIAAAIWYMRGRKNPWRPASGSSDWPALLWGLAGWSVGSIVVVATIAWFVGSPENFSIRWDNAFHLSAIRFAIETGDASSLSIGRLTSGGAQADFYPAAWHGLVSLVAEITDLSVPEAVNAVNLGVASCAWVAGSVFLGQVVARSAAIGALAGGVTAFLLHAFPMLLLDWGVLYPNFLGYALLPAVLALIATTFRVRGVTARFDPVGSLVALAIMVPGVALAHPSAALVALLAVVIFASVRAWEWASTAQADGSAARGVAVACTVTLSGVIVLAAAWLVARPSLAVAPWVAVQSAAQAFGEFVLNAHIGRPPSLLVSALAILGVVVLCARRHFAFVALAGAVGVMYVASTGLHNEQIRDLLVGPFYGDNNRVAALTALVVLPLVVVGAERLVEFVTASAHRRGSTNIRRAMLLSASAVLVLAVAASFVTTIVPAGRAAALGYRVTDSSELVDSDELELIRRLPESVPTDAVLIGEPLTGTPFAYALTGLTVTPPYMFFTPTAEDIVIRESLNRAASDPMVMSRVCSAVADLGGDVYVLDFRNIGTTEPFEGLSDLEAPVVSVVDAVGGARLLRVTICD